MAKNKVNFQKVRDWTFLLWIREVDKMVNKEKVAHFVHTYHMDHQSNRINYGFFFTSTIDQIFKLLGRGLILNILPYLMKGEAKEIFKCYANWIKDDEWHFEEAKHH